MRDRCETGNRSSSLYLRIVLVDRTGAALWSVSNLGQQCPKRVWELRLCSLFKNREAPGSHRGFAPDAVIDYNNQTVRGADLDKQWCSQFRCRRSYQIQTVCASFKAKRR